MTLCSNLRTASLLALMGLFVMSCKPSPTPAPRGEEHASGKAVEESPPAPEPLEIDPSIPSMEGSFEDRSKILPERRPWDNYKPYAPLTTSFTSYVLVQAYEAYKQDFVGTLLREGAVDFQLVHHFYTSGLLTRDKRDEHMAMFLAWIKKQPKAERDQYRKNLSIALYHIGFEDEALAFVKQHANATWVTDSWDVNAYTGRVLFRWGRFDEALPYLERAHTLDASAWNKLWLKLARLSHSKGNQAADEEDLLPFGEHLGPDDPAAFPFRDRAKEWGLGSWALAGSAAFFDFDNDTYLDMVQTSSNYSPEFYRFKPGVGFERTEMKPLTELANLVPGALAADFDNDGYTDLYLSSAAWFGAGTNRLLRNDKGEGFTDLSALGDNALSDHKTVSAAALDFDQDGLLDIVATGMRGGAARVLKNQGGMTFKDVTAQVGVKTNTNRFCVHITAGDVNNDGWTDFFSNCFTNSELYINQRDGTFIDEAGERGIIRGRVHGFATWMFDYDHDEDLDIVAAAFATRDIHFLGGFGGFPPEHFTKEYPKDGIWRPSLLYRNDGKGNFDEIGEQAGLMTLGVMGGQFIDMELDGKLDIILGPGSHPLHNIQPLFVYRNNGDDTFTNVVPVSDARYWGKNHGLAYADIDRDGDPDLFVNNGGVMPSDHWRDMLLENTTTGKTWIHIGLKGTTSNASAIGARVVVHAGGKTLMQERAAGQGFGGTNSPYLIFGLDQAQYVEKVTIRWPNRAEQTLPPLAVNQAIIVTEGSDALRRIY